MTAEIVQFIPRPNPNRDQRTLEQQAIEIMNVVAVDDTAQAGANALIDALFGCGPKADTAPSEMTFPAWPCEPHYLAPEEDPA